MSQFVVKVWRKYKGSPEYFDDYLEAVSYNEYLVDYYIPPSLSRHKADAFVFRSRTAAETIAAMVGGRVVKLVRKQV